MTNDERDVNETPRVISEAARDRVKRAHQAYERALMTYADTSAAAGYAAGTAMLVEITPDLVESVRTGCDLEWPHEAETFIRVVLAECGFEVRP